MSVNATGLASAQAEVYASYKTDTSAKTESASKKNASAKADTASKTEEKNESGVVYDKSDKSSDTGKATYSVNKMSAEDRAALVKQLKADQESRQQQLTNIVKQMMGQQATTFATSDDSMWKFLAKGDFTVDAETKAKAQKDIAEDGYWGVEQTSDRIVSFATALAGDDSKALEKMRDAFVKGYKQAEKQWGGKLPDISQRTYDAVMKKFDSLSSKKEEKSDSDGKVIIKDNTTTEDTANPLA